MNSDPEGRDAIARQFIRSIVEDALRTREESLLEAVKAEVIGVKEEIASGIRGAIREMVNEELERVKGGVTVSDAAARAALVGEVEQIKGELAFLKGKVRENTEMRGVVEEMSAAMSIIGNRINTIEQRLQSMDYQYQQALEKRFKNIETVLDGMLGTSMGKQFIAENYVLDTERYQAVVTNEMAEWDRLSKGWSWNFAMQQQKQQEARDENTRRRKHNIMLRDLSEVDREYAKAETKDAWRRSAEGQTRNSMEGGSGSAHSNSDQQSLIEVLKMSEGEKREFEERCRKESKIAEENMRRVREKKRVEDRERLKKEKEREAAKRRAEAAQREATKRQMEAEQRMREAEQRQAEEAQRQRDAALSSSERRHRDAVESYWREYERQSQGEQVPLTFASIRWPMLESPSDPRDISDKKEAIANFLLSPYHSAGIADKKRLNNALLRWHPDKWYGTHPMIVPEEHELVKEGITAVVICLRSIQDHIRARDG